MSKKKVKIKVDCNDCESFVFMPRRALMWGGGLAVCRTEPMTHWVVTHIRSGHRVSPVTTNVRTAIALFKALEGIIDWDRLPMFSNAEVMKAQRIWMPVVYHVLTNARR